MMRQKKEMYLISIKEQIKLTMKKQFNLNQKAVEGAIIKFTINFITNFIISFIIITILMDQGKLQVNFPSMENQVYFDC